jgi:uncharacterized membrane protein
MFSFSLENKFPVQASKTNESTSAPHTIVERTRMGRLTVLKIVLLPIRHVQLWMQLIETNFKKIKSTINIKINAVRLR